MTGESWTQWQGQVINGSIPLGRVVGSSDHSGVFATRFAAPGSPELAVKLVPADRALTGSLLPRWKRAGGIHHPHLIRLLQWGGCRLGGMPFLYIVMEYAEQTLAQVLQHRALDEDEARKVLQPTLDALAFLHGQQLVHSRLTPSNILVVGDELKLASDTICRIGDAPIRHGSATPGEPPQAPGGSTSAAGDVWALGACLYEALTRRPPVGPGETAATVVLPAEFPPAYRDIVSRCLSPSPESRPSAAELASRVHGSTAAPSSQPALPGAAASVSPPAVPDTERAPAAPAGVAGAAAERRQPASSESRFRHPRAIAAAALGVVVILALGWTAMRAVQPHRASGPPPSVARPPAPAPGTTSPVTPADQAVHPAVAPLSPGGHGLPPPPTALRQVTPEVPPSALRTIRGHVKVWVRVIVDRDGSVFAATADRAGPSIYFERLAIEAAKQWTFAPADAESERLVQIRFDFSREGATARAVAVR